MSTIKCLYVAISVSYRSARLLMEDLKMVWSDPALKNTNYYLQISFLDYLPGFIRLNKKVDLCELEGSIEITVTKLIAEIGTDINQWKSEKRFTGWLNLCPNTKISGGKIINSRIIKKKNHSGVCLR